MTHMMTFGQRVHDTMMRRGLNGGSLKTSPLTLEARRGPTWHVSSIHMGTCTLSEAVSQNEMGENEC